MTSPESYIIDAHLPHSDSTYAHTFDTIDSANVDAEVNAAASAAVASARPEPYEEAPPETPTDEPKDAETMVAAAGSAGWAKP